MSFLKKFKSKPASETAAADKKGLKPAASKTSTPDQDTVGNQAVAEQIKQESAQKKPESSLLDDLTEEKEKPAAKEKAAKGGKKAKSPEEEALKQAILEEALIGSGLMKKPKDKSKEADKPARPSKLAQAGSALSGAGSAVAGAASTVASGAARAGKGAMKGIKNGLGGEKKPTVGLTSVGPAADAKTTEEVAAETVVETHTRVEAEHEADIQAYLAAHPDVKLNGHAFGVRGGDGNLTYTKQQVDGAKTPEETGRVGKDGAEPAVKDDPFMLKTTTLNKTELEALKSYGLTADEILAVNLYTSDAAYKMNTILRGGNAYESDVRELLPWAIKLDSALAKMPKDVRNVQNDGSKIDDSKEAGDRVQLKTAYRSDKYGDAFNAFMKDSWGVGKRISDPGFFSASTKQGSYADLPVSRTIDMNGTDAAVSIMDASNMKQENEVLFRPGTQMQITKITQEGTDLKNCKGFDLAELTNESKKSMDSQRKLDVHMKVLPMPGGKKKEAKGSGSGKDAQAGEKAKQADADTVKKLLAKSPVQ